MPVIASVKAQAYQFILIETIQNGQIKQTKQNKKYSGDINTVKKLGPMNLNRKINAWQLENSWLLSNTSNNSKQSYLKLKEALRNDKLHRLVLFDCNAVGFQKSTFKRYFYFTQTSEP